MIKNCIVCYKSFEIKTRAQKCCSEECSKLNRIKADKAKHARYKLGKPKPTRKCVTCGNEFEGKQGKQYCSGKCNPYERRLYNNKCEQCGKEYKTESRISIYCSNKCVGEANVKHNATCLNCGKEFTDTSEEPRKFCSRDCFLDNIGAEKWETKREWELSDASSIRRAKKYGVKYEHIIPVEIFNRDNWICRLCGVGVSHSLAYPHPMSASLNHIIPLSKNGTHTTENVQLVHMGCSLRKSNKYEGEVFNANTNEKSK